METQTTKPGTSAKTPPPYFAFKTLLNTMEDMRKRAIPNRIDRTFLSGMSGAGQTQFIAGLRSLGLIDAAGTVSDRFKEMVNASPEDRQRLMGEILQERYPEAVELGKTNATTGELVDVFRKYGVQGDTARKAIAFYLQAAKYAGNVPLSTLFQTPKVTATGKKRKARSNGGSGNGDRTPDDKPDRFVSTFDGLHPALAGIISDLPTHGRGWTAERRTGFMATFKAVVEYTIPIVDEEPEPDEDEVSDEETADALDED